MSRSFTTAAELHWQAQQREKPPPHAESLSWSQEDWSQQERMARQKLNEQRSSSAQNVEALDEHGSGAPEEFARS